MRKMMKQVIKKLMKADKMNEKRVSKAKHEKMEPMMMKKVEKKLKKKSQYGKTKALHNKKIYNG